MLIGRENEKKELLSVINSDASEFVAVYGRRRVGKTYLIRETFNYKFTFQHTGMANTTSKKQLTSGLLQEKTSFSLSAVLQHRGLLRRL